mmetsp:Transcript_1454/g.1753  ORF Transcript_1454/g.1753 Transcript_1454/m.1753 type:complete len:212 (-) Transcript_1454:389-1024(-)
MANSSASLYTYQKASVSTIHTPLQKLHFVDHPRYGKVYPVVCVNYKPREFSSAVYSTFSLTGLNGLVLYSALVQPIFVPTISAFVANPLFLIPSLALNYALYNRYFVYFYGSRSFVQNIFLKPNGKQVVIETCDDETKVVNNKDIFDVKTVDTKFDFRTEFYHGANIFCNIRGNMLVYDQEILGAILKNKFIDTKNVQYDYDLTKEFTWDF